MPKPHDARKEALSDLERKLEAFEAKQGPKARYASGQAFNEGYRLVASLIGGVLGGIGLGWLFDYFAHTSPAGMIGGLLIGTLASIFAAVRASVRMSQKALKDGPPPAAPLDEDDD
jgi:ATP synthase protein I